MRLALNLVARNPVSAAPASTASPNLKSCPALTQPNMAVLPGDVINIITKSGGNDFHGTLFEFFRNDGLDAKNYFETIPTALHLNQFGGNLGGPIVRNKLFFFMNYEGVRQSVDSPTGPIPVMTAATKAMAVPAMAPIVALLPDPNPALGPVIFPNPGGPPIVRNDLGYFEGNLRNTIREDTGSVRSITTSVER